MGVNRYPGNVITTNAATPTVESASGVWTIEEANQNIRNWPMAQVRIDNSLRFNSADSAYLSRTPATASNRKTWTWSGWVKFCAEGNVYLLSTGLGSSSGVYFEIAKYSSGVINIANGTSDMLRTTQLFRDFSAWYHIVVSVDTTNATADDRVRLYVNGSQVTAFSARNNPTQNTELGVNSTIPHYMSPSGYSGSLANYGNFYLTEINFIDGLALDADYFGFFDANGIWQPRAYKGAYGTNGFYINFSDNSNTTAATLGKDYSGNGNNWTPNNFSVTAGSGNDSMVDSPTNYGTDTGVGGEVRGNYATLNPLAIDTSSRTYSNGNLDVSISTSNVNVFGSMQIPTSGKWYWEFQITTIGGGGAPMGGVAAGFITDVSTAVVYRTNGNKIVDGAAQSAYGATYTTTDIIGVAVDVDGGSVTFYKNGSSQGALTYSAGGLFPVLRSNVGTDNFTINFGATPFAYTAPSGFKALCTQNLPEPTIADGKDYMDVATYTGNGSTQDITGLSFAPDFVWIKNRGFAYSHQLFDKVRGVYLRVFSNTTDAESSDNNSLTAFNSDGFSVGSNAGVNGSSYAQVGWCWKANGAGVSNTAGTISSTVSANTTAGFSIVTYTGTGTSGQSVGHGLGVKPGFIIVKNRTYSPSGWVCWHQALTGGSEEDRYIYLNLTDASGVTTDYWGTSGITSSTFGVWATGGDNNRSGADFVAYCFSAIAGYSAFGSYTGNGSTDGPFVFTGFRPRFILWKRSDGVEGWWINDTSRLGYNGANRALFPNSSSAEDTANNLDILSNGFKIRGSGGEVNASGGTYIYAAFAENPFKLSRAR